MTKHEYIYNHKNKRGIFLGIPCHLLSSHVDSSWPAWGYRDMIENSYSPKVSPGADYYSLLVTIAGEF